jgi:hypothetical protein
MRLKPTTTVLGDICHIVAVSRICDRHANTSDPCPSVDILLGSDWTSNDFAISWLQLASIERWITLKYTLNFGFSEPWLSQRYTESIIASMKMGSEDAANALETNDATNIVFHSTWLSEKRVRSQCRSAASNVWSLNVKLCGFDDSLFSS